MIEYRMIYYEFDYDSQDVQLLYKRNWIHYETDFYDSILYELESTKLTYDNGLLLNNKHEKKFIQNVEQRAKSVNPNLSHSYV